MPVDYGDVDPDEVVEIGVAEAPDLLDGLEGDLDAPLLGEPEKSLGLG
jgi:hypothetical protein